MMDCYQPCIVLQNSYVRYGINALGQVTEFVDVRNGKNYVKPDSLFTYLVPQTEDGDAKPVPPDCVLREGSEIVIKFSEPAVTFRLMVQEYDTNFRFTISSCVPEKAGYGRFVFAACDLQDAADGFACTSVSLHTRCNTLAYPGQGMVAGAAADSRLDAAGVSCALIGSPTDKIQDCIKAAMAHLTVNDFPISAKGGAYAADTPEAYGDYIIDCITRNPEDLKDLDRWLEPVVSAGILQINFHQGALYRHSDFEFKKEVFPEGVADFRRMVTDPMHKKGLLACFHTYSSMVDKKSCYVTPVPHPDLEALHIYTLAETIGEDDKDMIVLESTADIPAAHSLSLCNSLTLAIDNELLEFKTIGTTGFYQCERGCCGTKKATHVQGTKVRHLKEAFGMFLSRIGSPLFYEIAQQTAEAFNNGGFDAIYLDGLDFVPATIGSGGESGSLKGLEWYYAALFVWEVLKHIRKPALMEYSAMYPSLWYARSRNIAWDYPTRAYKHWHDLHSEGAGFTEKPIPLLPRELGWFNLYPSMDEDDLPLNSGRFLPNWSVKYHYSDDVDYLGSKSVAYDAGLSYIATTSAHRGKYPILGRYSRQIAPYSRLRTEKYFSQAVKDRLKRDKTGFRLVNEDGNYGFEQLERLYVRPYLLSGEHSDKVCNPFSSQKPFIRLEAHFGGAPYEDPHGLTIARFNSEKPVSEQKLLHQFAAPLDLSGREALGIWIRSNGCKGYINIQLESPKTISYLFNGVSEHIIPLCFEGLKYFSLCEDNFDEYPDIEFISNKASLYARYREYMTYQAVSNLSVLLAGDCQNIFISDIHALPVISDPIINPGVEIGGESVRFDCVLKPGEYIEYKPGEAYAIRYDPCGNTREVNAIGVVGDLPHGESMVRVLGGAAGDHRLTMHLLVTGERIFN